MLGFASLLGVVTAVAVVRVLSLRTLRQFQIVIAVQTLVTLLSFINFAFTCRSDIEPAAFVRSDTKLPNNDEVWSYPAYLFLQ